MSSKYGLYTRWLITAFLLFLPIAFLSGAAKAAAVPDVTIGDNVGGNTTLNTAISFTVTVTDAFTPAATDTAQVEVDGIAVGSAVNFSGASNAVTVPLAAGIGASGDHTINVLFTAGAGETNYSTGTPTGTDSVTIRPQPVITIGDNVAGNTTYGTAVSYTVTIANTPVPAAGDTAELTIDGTPEAADKVTFDGTDDFVTITPSAQLPVGTHLIGVVFTPSVADTGYSAVTTGTLDTVIVNAATSGISGGYGVNPVNLGDTVTLTATITIPVTSPPAPAPTGQVHFADSNLSDPETFTVSTSTFVLQSTGSSSTYTATATISGLAAGIYSDVVATYGGDVNYNASSVTLDPLDVRPMPTGLSITTPANTGVSSVNAYYGVPVSFTDTLTPNVVPEVPTGDETVTVGADSLTGTGVVGPLSDVITANLDGSSVPDGLLTFGVSGSPYVVTYSYPGDANYSPDSAVGSYTVNPDTTSTTITTSNNPSVTGQTLTFTATVTNTTPNSIANPAEAGATVSFGIDTALGSDPAGGSVIHPVHATLTNAGTNASGQEIATASITVPSLVFNEGSVYVQPGNHNIYATYNTASSNFVTSNGTLVQQVSSTTTTTVAPLAPSTNPEVLNNDVYVDVTVQANQSVGGTNPDGSAPPANDLAAGGATVNVYVNGTLAVANVPLTDLPVSPANQYQAHTGSIDLASTLFPTSGSYTITAVYSGNPNPASTTVSTTSVDGNYGSTGTLQEQIESAATTTVLTSSQDPADTSTTNQTVTYTATVSSTYLGEKPTGTVIFYDNGVTIGATLVNPTTGVASINATYAASQAPNPHAILAVYSGDSNFATSVSSAVSDTVSTTPTATTLAAPGTSVAGASISLTATVTPGILGPFSPTGTVTFSDSIQGPLGSGQIVNGAVTISAALNASGSHLITATYAGDSNFGGSVSTASTVTVGLAATTSTVVSSANPSGLGAAVTYTATVAPVVPGTGTPTGTVTFKSNGTTIGTGTLSGGVASYTTTATPPTAGQLAAGSDSITVTYGGDSNFSGSASSILLQVVNPGPTSTTLAITYSGSPNPAVNNEPVTLTATVTDTGTTFGTPGGTVTFYSGTTALGTATLTAGVSGTATATVTAPASTVGSPFSITATYSGDTAHTTSTSTASTLTVNSGNVTVSLVSSTNPSTVGQPITLTATVTPVSPAVGTDIGGTISFWDGTVGTGTLLGTVPLTQNVASLLEINLAFGTHLITAVYSGNGSWTSANSNVLSQQVNEPTPILVGLSQSSAQEGSSATTITLTGTNFLPGLSTVILGPVGSPLATLSTTDAPTDLTVIDANTISAKIPASLLTDETTFQITVHNPNTGGVGNSQSETFTVTDAPLTGTGVTINGQSSVPLTSVLTATFHDGNTTTSTVGDFTASIEWGDGSSASAGTVTSQGSGNFTVTGTHTYVLSPVSGTTSFTPIVTITDDGGSTLSISSSAVIQPPVNYFPANLQLISLPYNYSGTELDASSILGNSVIVWWDPAGSLDSGVPEYDVYPHLNGADEPGAQTLPGRGYWINPADAFQLTNPELGGPVASPFAESLSPGWNLIGDPFTSVVDWSNVQFKASVAVNGEPAGTVLSLAEAQSGGLIASALYAYSPTGNDYVYSQTLAPFTGYWIYVSPLITSSPITMSVVDVNN